MFRRMFLCAALLSSVAVTGEGQAPVRPTDPVFVRAQALVSDGNGAAGRALIDSVITATPPMAPLYPQALFWRASLAASAADAESDYKHIVVDYPLAPQAADALLRLAQLELARGDKDGALAHLRRIPRDYPRSKSLARASYWTARVLFEKNEIANACAANASALAQTDSTEIELRNQVQYQGQRCPAAVAVASAPPTIAAPSTAPIVTSNPSVAGAPPVVAAPVSPVNESAASPATPVSSAPVQQPSAASSQQSRPKPPTEANDAKPSIVDPAKAPRAVTAKPETERLPVEKLAAEKPTAKASATAPSSGYSVQVAAYRRIAEAESLVSTLKDRGYQARVDAADGWFRVRIGRYATAKDAEEALKRIKAKHMDGFVVRAPER